VAAHPIFGFISLYIGLNSYLNYSDAKNCFKLEKRKALKGTENKNFNQEAGFLKRRTGVTRRAVKRAAAGQSTKKGREKKHNKQFVYITRFIFL